MNTRKRSKNSESSTQGSVDCVLSDTSNISDTRIRENTQWWKDLSDPVLEKYTKKHEGQNILENTHVTNISPPFFGWQNHLPRFPGHRGLERRSPTPSSIKSNSTGESSLQVHSVGRLQRKGSKWNPALLVEKLDDAVRDSGSPAEQLTGRIASDQREKKIDTNSPGRKQRDEYDESTSEENKVENTNGTDEGIRRPRRLKTRSDTSELEIDPRPKLRNRVGKSAIELSRFDSALTDGTESTRKSNQIKIPGQNTSKHASPISPLEDSFDTERDLVVEAKSNLQKTFPVKRPSNPFHEALSDNTSSADQMSKTKDVEEQVQEIQNEKTAVRASAISPSTVTSDVSEDEIQIKSLRTTRRKNAVSAVKNSAFDDAVTDGTETTSLKNDSQRSGRLPPAGKDISSKSRSRLVVVNDSDSDVEISIHSRNVKNTSIKTSAVSRAYYDVLSDSPSDLNQAKRALKQNPGPVVNRIHNASTHYEEKSSRVTTDVPEDEIQIESRHKYRRKNTTSSVNISAFDGTLPDGTLSTVSSTGRTSGNETRSRRTDSERNDKSRSFTKENSSKHSSHLGMEGESDDSDEDGEVPDPAKNLKDISYQRPANGKASDGARNDKSETTVRWTRSRENSMIKEMEGAVSEDHNADSRKSAILPSKPSFYLAEESWPDDSDADPDYGNAARSKKRKISALKRRSVSKALDKDLSQSSGNSTRAKKRTGSLQKSTTQDVEDEVEKSQKVKSLSREPSVSVSDISGALQIESQPKHRKHDTEFIKNNSAFADALTDSTESTTRGRKPLSLKSDSQGRGRVPPPGKEISSKNHSRMTVQGKSDDSDSDVELNQAKRASKQNSGPVVNRIHNASTHYEEKSSRVTTDVPEDEIQIESRHKYRRKNTTSSVNISAFDGALPDGTLSTVSSTGRTSGNETRSRRTDSERNDKSRSFTKENSSKHSSHLGMEGESDDSDEDGEVPDPAKNLKDISYQRPANGKASDGARNDKSETTVRWTRSRENSMIKEMEGAVFEDHNADSRKSAILPSKPSFYLAEESWPDDSDADPDYGNAARSKKRKISALKRRSVSKALDKDLSQSSGNSTRAKKRTGSLQKSTTQDVEDEVEKSQKVKSLSREPSVSVSDISGALQIESQPKHRKHDTEFIKNNSAFAGALTDSTESTTRGRKPLSLKSDSQGRGRVPPPGKEISSKNHSRMTVQGKSDDSDSDVELNQAKRASKQNSGPVVNRIHNASTHYEEKSSRVTTDVPEDEIQIESRRKYRRKNTTSSVNISAFDGALPDGTLSTVSSTGRTSGNETRSRRTDSERNDKSRSFTKKNISKHSSHLGVEGESVDSDEDGAVHALSGNQMNISEYSIGSKSVGGGLSDGSSIEKIQSSVRSSPFPSELQKTRSPTAVIHRATPYPLLKMVNLRNAIAAQTHPEGNCGGRMGENGIVAHGPWNDTAESLEDITAPPLPIAHSTLQNVHSPVDSAAGSRSSVKPVQQSPWQAGDGKREEFVSHVGHSIHNTSTQENVVPLEGIQKIGVHQKERVLSPEKSGITTESGSPVLGRKKDVLKLQRKITTNTTNKPSGAEEQMSKTPVSPKKQQEQPRAFRAADEVAGPSQGRSTSTRPAAKEDKAPESRKKTLADYFPALLRTAPTQPTAPKAARKATPKAKPRLSGDLLVNGKKPNTRLAKPRPWVTERLYKNVMKSANLKPAKAEELIIEMCRLVSKALCCKKNFAPHVERLMKLLYKADIVKSRKDFYDFSFKYLPSEFINIAVPIMKAEGPEEDSGEDTEAE